MSYKWLNGGKLPTLLAMMKYLYFCLSVAVCCACGLEQESSDDSALPAGTAAPDASMSDCRNAVLECARGFRCLESRDGGYECIAETESMAVASDNMLSQAMALDPPVAEPDVLIEEGDQSADSEGDEGSEGASPANESPSMGMPSEPMNAPPEAPSPRGERGKSYKRGIASGFDSARDLEALSTGISWWYNWSPSYNDPVADLYAQYELDWVPMTWNGNNPDEIRAFLELHPNVRYLLTFNEPNFQDQANMTPEYAASIWPTFEAIADEYNVELIGPAVNFCGGCVVVDGSPIDSNYVVWLDMFFESFRAQFGREPRMDYTALHWYDYGLEDQVNQIVSRYNKPVWVTEFALWRSEDWNTDENERAWLTDMVRYLEGNPMVYRYAWFTGRRPDFPRINLLANDGELTPLGQAYLDAPY